MADWKEQSRRVWEKLGKRERYMIMGTAALLLAAILGWSYWWGGRPDRVPLFTGMESRDAGEVAAKLKEMKIPFEPQEAPNGTTILVSAKDARKVRLELAAQGLPRGQKGFELFDQNKFGATEFQNKVYYLQALQGELTRTIEEMSEVERARVHIVQAEDSLYKKNEKPATASIMLKLKPGAQLTKAQVRGIVNLTAHSVRGLKTKDVTVVNERGEVLNDPEDNEESLGAITMNQLQMTKKVQEDLQRSVQSLLDQVLGPNKSAARVSVELNFDQRSTDSQTFAPVVDDKGVLRSSQEMSESYSGASAAPGGPAGTTANIPGYVAADNKRSSYDKKEATRNYEVNETKEKVVAAPGGIRRITVAVLMDDKIPAAQQPSIANAVSSAIGLNAARGDHISVERIPFNMELADRRAMEEQAYQTRQNVLFYGAIAVIVLAVLAALYALRAWRRRKAERAEADALFREEQEAMSQAQTAAALTELSPEEQEKMAQRDALAQMAREKPEEVAQLVKVWLTDE